MAEAKQEGIDSGKYQLVFASAEDGLQRKEFLASLKRDSSPLAMKSPVRDKGNFYMQIPFIWQIFHM